MIRSESPTHSVLSDFDYAKKITLPAYLCDAVRYGHKIDCANHASLSLLHHVSHAILTPTGTTLELSIPVPQHLIQLRLPDQKAIYFHPETGERVGDDWMVTHKDTSKTESYYNWLPKTPTKVSQLTAPSQKSMLAWV